MAVFQSCCAFVIHMNIVQFYEATVQLKLRPGSAMGEGCVCEAYETFPFSKTVSRSPAVPYSPPFQSVPFESESPL